jgi:hypothetical protein
MKRCGGDAVHNGPIYRAPEHVLTHARDKAPIDHDAQRVQAVGNSLVVAAQVLAFVASL